MSILTVFFCAKLKNTFVYQISLCYIRIIFIHYFIRGKKMAETKTIQIDSNVWIKFTRYCKANGFIQWRLLMQIIKDYLTKQGVE